MYEPEVIEMRGRKHVVDKSIKACMKCGLTWEKVNKRVYQVSHFYYPLGVIPRIGKEKKTCPRCEKK